MKKGTSIRLFETHIPVSDLEQSVRFYTEVMSFEIALEEKNRNVVFLWMGTRDDGMLGLWGPGTSYGPKDGQIEKHHFAMRITLLDLLKAPERMRKKGIECRGFSGSTEDLPSVIGWMPSAQIYFVDPDGHSLELISMLQEEPDSEFVGSWSEWKNRDNKSAIATP